MPIEDELLILKIWLKSGKTLEIKGVNDVEENLNTLKITTIEGEEYTIMKPAIDVIMKKPMVKILQ